MLVSLGLQNKKCIPKCYAGLSGLVQRHALKYNLTMSMVISMVLITVFMCVSKYMGFIGIRQSVVSIIIVAAISVMNRLGR